MNQRACNAKCEGCTLHIEERDLATTDVEQVFVEGEGPIPCELMFVGEAPGEREVEQRRPFVGPSGQQLNRLLEKVSIKRTGCRISNSCVCRPPNNRPPTDTEVASCRPSLYVEVQEVDPKLIVALGRTAYSSLMNVSLELVPDLEHHHGFVYPVYIGGPRKILFTYHPSATLRSILWESHCRDDLARIKELLPLPKDEVIIENETWRKSMYNVPIQGPNKVLPGL